MFYKLRRKELKKMKLASAIKLLSQYGEVKQDKTGAKIKIDGWTYGASTNWNEQEVLFLYCECGADTWNRQFYSYNTLKGLKYCMDRCIRATA